MLSLEYIAGFFDGEGCIGVYRDTKGYTKLLVTIGQKSETPLLLIRECLGGKLSKPQSMTVHQLVWTNFAAGEMLEQIVPFLVLKKAQAELAIEFCTLLGTSGNWAATPEKTRRRLEIVDEVRDLKKVV
jgi:hypothetical protein